MQDVGETSSLIGSDKVSGDQRLQSGGGGPRRDWDVMIDKASGKVAYAVMSFGGFLGIGERYYPVPWSMLKYDTARGGYVVDLSKSRLEGAPSYGEGGFAGLGDRDYEARLHDFYGAGPYWM